MTLFFISGNMKKYEEIRAIFPEVESLEIDLSEIQALDSKKVVRAKILEAFNFQEGEFIVEDTSLHLECLNGLPGPLIKWFLKAIGNRGIYNIANKFKNHNAEAKTIVGYAQKPEEIHFFEGSVKGKIVAPRGYSGFGWDPIFQPIGSALTYAEMSPQEKNKISMRRIALDKLGEFLKNTTFKEHDPP